MINLGIIGFGRIFNKHFEAINQNKNIKLIAICEIDQKNLITLNFQM